MEIPKNLKDEIWEFCRLNDITNMDEFSIKLLRQGFTAEKYGATPLGLGKPAEPEVIEKIVEVPVEKIVEKYITNDEETKKLAEEVATLTKQLEDATLEIESLKKTLTNKNNKGNLDIYGE